MPAAAPRRALNIPVSMQWLLIYALISVIIVMPIFGEGVYFLSHEFLQVPLRIIETKNAFQSGQWPPAVLPDVVGGLGSGWYIFYPPLAYWVAYALFAMGFSVLSAIKISYFLMFFFSGVSMYACLSRMGYTTGAAGIGGALYLSAPYHLIDLYVRNAYAETFSFIWVPLIFLGLWDIFRGDGRKGWVLALGFSGVALSHLITVFYSLIFALLFSILMLVKYPRILKMRTFWRSVGLSTGITILLIAFFALPFVEHAQLGIYAAFDPSLKAEFAILPDIVHGFAIPLKSIFRLDLTLAHDTLGALGYQHQGPQMPYNLGIHLLVFALMGLYLGRYRFEVWLFAALLLLSIFATTQWMPWQSLPGVFSVIQFPWRLLLFASFFCVVLATHFFDGIIRLWPARSNLIVFTSAVGLCFYLYSALVTVTPTQIAPDAWLSKDQFYQRGANGGAEHLPSRFRRMLAPNTSEIDVNLQRAKILHGDGSFTNYQRSGTNHAFELQGKLANQVIRIQLPAVYYLGYSLNDVNLKKQNLFPCDNGLICADVTPGKYMMTYGATLLAKIGNTLSIMGLVSLLVFGWRSRNIGTAKI